MPLPFASLRTNLIAAFAGVIGVSLLLASGAFAYLLREYQADRERDRLELLAMQYTQSVVRWARNGQSLTTITAQLDQSAGDSGVRVLLFDDRGTVLHDTDNNEFTGRSFTMPHSGGRRPNVAQGSVSTPNGYEVFTIVNPISAERSFGVHVAVVAPEQSLTGAWQEALPRLSLAALSALVVSIVIAWWFASAITRPMVQITRASEEMARGNLDPDLTLPDTSDEVGRLSTAFATMAREVARSHRTMRDLMANVSHDLRTPLTSISGFAGALVDGTLSGPEGAREAGRVIGEEAERMRRLIEDLLYLGRIESGDLALRHDPVDLAELVRAVEARFVFRAQESNINLDISAPAPVPILGDRHRLGQVLDNLVENAFKHTPPSGSVRISAVLEGRNEVGRSPRWQRTAVLVVHNTGSHIPPHEAERVFERFYQVDKARAGRAGSGLGLAIAREIVQAHGGRIDLTSSLQTGTSLSVRIPALEPGALTPLTSSESARLAEVGAAHG